MLTDRIVTGGRLIGRESRLGRLRTAVDRTRDECRTRMVCVTGAEGVGKSALLAAFVEQPPERAIVGAGDARSDAGPYAALGAVLDGVVPGVSALPPHAVEEIVAAVGTGADLLLDLAPAWAALVPGGRPAVREPDHRAEQPPSAEHVRDRIHLTMQRLFLALVAHTGAVALVVDDLQHADRHSIDAFSALLCADDLPLVLIGAYPTKEVGAGHALRVLVDAASGRTATVVVTVDLRPLSDTAVTDLMAETLGMSHADVQGLAGVVVAGTRSNPLAVEQLLHWLAEQRLLAYDRQRSTWTWQLERVGAVAPAAARVAAVVQSRLNRLNPALLELLRVAALLGNRFRLDDLVRASGDQSAGLNERLRMAVQLEMLRLVDTSPAVYAWSHALVRQTVLENVTSDERASVAALLARGPDETPDATDPARLFELLGRVGDADLKPLRLAELHLAAARVANRRGATEVAHRHLRAGVEALPAVAWHRRYQLAFSLHIEGARAARALGDSRAADRMFDLAMEHARDDVDRAAVSRARLVLRWNRRGYGGDPRPGLAALRLLGVELPADDGDWAEAARLIVPAVHSRLSNLDNARHATTDQRVRFALDIIAELLGGVSGDADMSAVLAARGVELAVDHGGAPGSGYALAWFGVAVVARLRDEEAARRCAETALAMRWRDPHAAATKSTVALALPFLVGDPQCTLTLLREAHEIALDRGDVAAAMASLLMRPYYLLAIGAPLDQVADEIAASGRLAGEHGRFPFGEVVTDAVAEAVDELLGNTTRRAAPTDPGGPQTLAERSRRGELGYVSSLHLTGALMAAYLLGDHARAVELAEAAERVPVPTWAGLLDAERCFYHALALTARYRHATPEERLLWPAKISLLHQELERWAEHRPAGFAHKALLVSAEQARLVGDIETALGRYERVIGGARESGFLHVQAIAAELGGRCALEYAEAGGVTVVDALAYLRRARSCYQRWGARAKLDQLAGVLKEAPTPNRAAHPVDQLDLLNVVKAFQTISSVLDLDKLTATLLELLVHHSGAQRGCLLLYDEGALRLAAEATNDSDLVEIRRPQTEVLASLVPSTLVERVARTKELVLLDDPAFDADPYLSAHRPRAALAAPIANQGRLIGVLYLEHKHRADAFGPGQLDSLEVLCTQAAICLDNAAVYAKLAEANRILDATFERMPVGLIVLRPDLTVHRVSPHAINLLGLPIRTGTPFVDLIDVLTPVDSAGVAMRLDPALALIGPNDRVGEPRTVVIIRPDGERQHLQVWFMSLRDHDGHLLGVTLLVSEPDNHRKGQS